MSFGFGRDHDADLMDKIASVKDGNFYFIERLETIDEAFVSALGGMLSVVGQNLEIAVENPDPEKFSIYKTYGDAWREEGSTQNLRKIKL